jgi:hypothetical protein
LGLEASRLGQAEGLGRLGLGQAQGLGAVGLGPAGGAHVGSLTTSPRPVADLATANEVPVSTAQRWVKEARRRGLLAPGHPGKAG